MSNKESLRENSRFVKSTSPDNSYNVNSPQRSVTISHPVSSGSYTQSGGQENDNPTQTKLTKVNPYKVTRSRSINTFNDFRRSSEISPIAFTKPLTSGQLNQELPQSPQEKDNTVAKFARNSIDDDNAETPISFGQNSLNIPAYYCMDQNAINESPLSTGSIPVARILADNNTASATRNATVIFRKKNKSPYESDYDLSEISPMSNESSPLRPLRKSTTQVFKSPIKEEGIEEIDLNDDKEKSYGHSPLATVLHPLVYNTSPYKKTMFQEEEEITKMDDQSDSFSRQASNGSSSKSSGINWTSEFPIFQTKGFLILFIALMVIIILLLVGFIPAVVILSRGTRTTIDNYFSNSKNLPYLNELSQKYFPSPIEIVPNKTRINSIEGLNDEVKNDLEVVGLMDVVTNFMFQGIAYSPNNVMVPNCGFSKKDAMLDLAKLSTVTTRIRNYGMQCNQTEIILDAIEYMNLNITLAMGVWISSNSSINKMQMDMMKRMIAKYPNPSRLIHSIYIGNEVLFRQDKTKEELIEYIHDAKDFLKLMHINDIPVGTSELGSLIDRDLLQACDIIGANIHPFFGGVLVEDAVDWILEFLHYQIEPYNVRNIPIVITEVGWPSGGGKFKGAIASPANLQYFVNEFLCTFNKMGIDYYFFEAFDEPWKEMYNEGNRRWETHWGIFNADRSNKFNLQRSPCP